LGEFYWGCGVEEAVQRLRKGAVEAFWVLLMENLLMRRGEGGGMCGKQKGWKERGWMGATHIREGRQPHTWRLEGNGENLPEVRV
jgi:hypothetical protein